MIPESGVSVEPPMGFEPCSPCFNPNQGKIMGLKEPPPGPHWSVFVIGENGEERLGSTCKDGFGFLSCPNSPRNAEVAAMTKEEKDAWGASLFPLMDVGIYFHTVFGLGYWKWHKPSNSYGRYVYIEGVKSGRD